MRGKQKTVLSLVLALAMIFSLGVSVFAAEAKAPAAEDVVSIQATTDMAVYGQKLSKVEIIYKEGTDLSGVDASFYTLYDRGSANPAYAPAVIEDVAIDGSTVTLTITQDTEKTSDRSRNAIGAVTTAGWYIDVEGNLYYGKEDSEDPISGDKYLANTTGKGYQTRPELDLVLCQGGEGFEEGLALTNGFGIYQDTEKWLPSINEKVDKFTLETVDVNAAVSEALGEEYVAEGYEAFGGQVPVQVYVPSSGGGFGAAPAPKAMIVYVCGGGTSYWELTDEAGNVVANNPGTNLNFDCVLTNWLDQDVVIISPHVHSAEKAKGAREVAAVVDAMAAKYNVDTDKIIFVGNSNGDAILSETIRTNPEMADTFFVVNGDFGDNDAPDGVSPTNRDSLARWTDEEISAVAKHGLRVWFHTGETDSRHILVCQMAYEKLVSYYQAAGWSDEWIAENVRISGYHSWHYKYWGESDHSSTRMVWSYYADAPYFDVYEDGEPLQPGDTYQLKGDEEGATYEGQENFVYTVYPETLHEWALNPKAGAPSTLSIRSIQAYTDETMYGTGVVRVVINYMPGVDLSGLTAESFVLTDRGTMTPDFGEVKIADVKVSGHQATLIISGESAATEANVLVYTGDNPEGPRQRNAFGVYCTNPWYRDVEGKIHFGEEATEEYAANETGMGYQARACLELKLRHADEPEEAVLCLADDLGQYTAAGKWLPTIDLQFGEGGFLDLHDLEIPSTAAAATDGSGDDFVRGFYYVPENYDPACGIVFTIQGQGISYWQLPDGTNDAGTGIMYDSATTSWTDQGAIVVNIHDRSSAASKFGEYDEAGYDYVVDDVNVMKYFIEKYGVTGNIVIQGNSRGTGACSTIIRALAGQPYGINGDSENLTTLDKSVYDFMVDAYICNNGGFRGSQEDYEAIAKTGMKVWAFDGEQDSNNIENLAAYREACKTAGLSDEWIAENVRLTGYTSNIYAPWGESDHSTTRMNGWYFDEQAYYGPDCYIDENGRIAYNTKLADGDTYTLEARGSAAASSKAGYEYTIYDDLFQVWATTDTNGEIGVQAITEPGHFGQKLSTVILSYPAEIDGSKLNPEDFVIRALDNNLEGTYLVSTIDRIYTNSEPAPLEEGSVNGPYVIIETNPFDKVGVVASAYYYKNADGSVGNITIRKDVEGCYYLDVRQSADIEAADGTAIPAASAPIVIPQNQVKHDVLDEFQYVFVNDEEANEILSEFTFGNDNSPYSLSSNTRTYDHTALTEKDVLGDLNEATLAGLGVRIWYQLPENYDPAQKYPLFLYAHGTGECYTTAVTGDGRELSNDGVHFNFGYPTGIWATTENMGLQDCIVVAPQYYSGNSPRDDGYERDDAFRVALCYALKNLAVDRDKVFVSGTSQGAGRTTALVRDCAEYITAAIVQNGAYSSALSRAKDVDPIGQHQMIFKYATDNNVAFWFFQGVNDFISPPLTSETMYQALVANYKEAGKSDEWIDENVRYTYLNDKIYLDMNETSFHSTMKPTYNWYAYYKDELYHATYSDAEDSLGEYFDTRYGANDPGGFSGMVEWALTRSKE